jgi:small basic protein
MECPPLPADIARSTRAWAMAYVKVMFSFFSFVFFRRLFLACSEVVLTLTRWIIFIFNRTGLVLFIGTACKFATMIVLGTRIFTQLPRLQRKELKAWRRLECICIHCPSVLHMRHRSFDSGLGHRRCHCVFFGSSSSHIEFRTHCRGTTFTPNSI